ncbi:MAG: carboxymuconolactone decarboxylase family protein [Actinobacteria bacterium]|nr:carboxymuconolactone decarboxylase family protein [Actinomycetota bacterium]
MDTGTPSFNPQAGDDLLAHLQDEATREDWTSTLDSLAPGVSDWIRGAVFGGLYQRPGLSLRDRQLLNLGALTALGGVDPQLHGHVLTCHGLEMEPAEIIEAFVHLIPYVGLPKALAALRVAGAATEGLDDLGEGSATHRPR